MAAKRTFTGRRRNLRTTFRVRAVDALARLFITLGGTGTILAVLLVCLFLVSVTLPLFSSPTVALRAEFAAPWGDEVPVKVALDEYQAAGWALLKDGTVLAFRADNGKVFARQALTTAGEITATSFAVGGDTTLACGFADGSVRLGRIEFKSEPPNAEQTAAARNLLVGQFIETPDGLLHRLGDDQVRFQRLHAMLQPEAIQADTSPIRLIDHVTATNVTTFCVLSADGKLRIHSARERKNMRTQAVSYTVTKGELPAAERRDSPSFLRLAGLGDNVFLAWDDGHLVRYDTRDLSDTKIAERVELLAEQPQSPVVVLKSLEFLLGRGTLLAGDSAGRVGVWFRIKPEDAKTVDGAVLTRVRSLSAKSATPGITALTSSARNRIALAGDESGRAQLYYVTGGTLLQQVSQPGNYPVSALAFAPKADGMLVAAGGRCVCWALDMAHPEASWRTLFRPIWYEGYEAPAYVWQSSSATDDFETKLSLIPLIFGTLKATFYSMLIAAPLALLAAVYSNTFLTRRAHARIKPTIELMAGLPSVVLGFLAAIVVAPLVERHIPSVLLLPLCVGVACLLGAHLWQLLPRGWAVRLTPWRFLFVALLAVPVGLFAARGLGTYVETWFFAGDIKRWLDGQIGTGTGGWLLLVGPLLGGSALIFGQRLGDWLPEGWLRNRYSDGPWWELGKFVAGCGLVLALTWLTAVLLTTIGLDPRGTFVGRYDQRNAMVVGFLMAFAIIPIIYTIADDALSAVPETLRSASLGAGATEWQTTVRIIVPTAMSGLFSAVMIGLGRAVGETMIVLMAAGNTPVMSLNLFNGLRSLSANIAVELPEAVKNSTHFRTLFLAALTLFAMTFVVNTIAESVRLRFRKRAYEL